LNERAARVLLFESFAIELLALDGQPNSFVMDGDPPLDNVYTTD